MMCYDVSLASQADSWECVSATGLFMPHVLSSSSQSLMETSQLLNVFSVLVHFLIFIVIYLTDLWGLRQRFSSRGRHTLPPLSLCDSPARNSVQRQTMERRQ